jgi:hypothetical protein
LDWTANVAPHFAWSEVVTGTPEAVTVRRAGLADDANARAALAKTCVVAEWIRGLVDCPIRITSGYRGPERTGSQHDTGHALDIQVDGISALELLELVHAHADEAPHPLRQVIAESLHTSVLTLEKPMAARCGVWLHFAIATGEWRRPSTLPWATSVAPVSGRRMYAAWAP